MQGLEDSPGALAVIFGGSWFVVWILGSVVVEGVPQWTSAAITAVIGLAVFYVVRKFLCPVCRWEST